jgi:uncharacterized protein (TIGR03435 family)
VRFLRRAGSLVVWASLSILACVCCLRTAHGQSLDVASVKPSAPDVSPILCNGGPGTGSPRVWRCGNMPLALVVQRAFHFQEFQFSSHAPCCLGRFDFDVRLPEGAARDEFDRMLQNLLRERFKLAFHYGTKEMSGYELTLAPKGPAFRETTQPGKPPEGRWWEPPISSGQDKDGYRTFDKGVSGLASAMDHYHLVGLNTSMQELADALSEHLQRPVVNSTGLAGRYDVDLKWVRRLSDAEAAQIEELGGDLPETPAGATLFRAVQDQLGLRLVPKKAPAQIVVIDHVEKKPTEN